MNKTKSRRAGTWRRVRRAHAKRAEAVISNAGEDAEETEREATRKAGLCRVGRPRTSPGRRPSGRDLKHQEAGARERRGPQQTRTLLFFFSPNCVF